MAKKPSQPLFRKLDRNLEKIVIVVLALIVGGVLQLNMTETDSTPLQTPTIESAKLDEVLPSDNSKAVERMFAGAEDMGRSEYADLIKYNMFQVLSEKERAEFEKQTRGKEEAPPTEPE